MTIIATNTVFLFPSIATDPETYNRICVVTDPTGTPLNIRKTPNGRIIGKVRNGKKVRAFYTHVPRYDDEHGKEWVEIKVLSRPFYSGVVLRDFISCL